MASRECVENLGSLGSQRWVQRCALLFCALALFLLASCSDPIVEFTQCVRPLDAPAEFTRPYYRDDRRACYGNRWRMPRERRGTKHVAYKPVAEEFEIKLAQGNQLGTATGRLRVGPILSSSQRVLTDGIAAYEVALQLSDEPERRFGMKLKQRLKQGQVSDALFVREHPPFLYALCRPTPKADGTRRLEQSVCDVHAAFGDVAHVQFTLRYDQLGRVEHVVNDVFTLLEEFLIAKH